MSALSNLYDDVKNLIKQFVYDKTEIDNLLNVKADKSKHIIEKQTLTSTTSGITVQEITNTKVLDNSKDWTVEGDIYFTGVSARFQMHLQGDTTANNHLGVGINSEGRLAFYYATGNTGESNNVQSITIELNKWYRFRLSKIGSMVIFDFDDIVFSATATYFSSLASVTPCLVEWGTNTSISVKNLRMQYI